MIGEIFAPGAEPKGAPAAFCWSPEAMSALGQAILAATRSPRSPLGAGRTFLERKNSAFIGLSSIQTSARRKRRRNSAASEMEPRRHNFVVVFWRRPDVVQFGTETPLRSDTSVYGGGYHRE